MPYILKNEGLEGDRFLQLSGAVTPEHDTAKQFDDLNVAVSECAALNMTSPGLWSVEEAPYALQGAA